MDSITREQLENIERISDAGSVAAYAGVSHIILQLFPLQNQISGELIFLQKTIQYLLYEKRP